MSKKQVRGAEATPHCDIIRKNDTLQCFKGKKRKKTQKDRVLEYIQEFGSISRREGFMDLGIVELSSRIGELEAMGYCFDKKMETSKNRYGENVHYTRYSLADR